MPQPPRNSTDDFGADDEIKEYKHEDGEENENGATLDLVNDIKTDLIKKEAEHQEDQPKTPTDASSAPIAQLLSFPDKYNEHLVPGHGNYHRNQHSSESKAHSRGQPQSPVYHPGHQGYPSGPYPYTVYPSIKAERYHYDPPLWQPHGAIIGQGSYHPNYPPPVNPTTAGIQRLTHPTMTGDQRSGVHCGPAPPPNHSVITRAPPSCGSGKSYTTAMMSESLEHGRDSKISHVKKPLNAFMLYMKDMRPKVVAECTLKESAAINQILGKKWHALERAEQAKYYEMARKERALHMQLYPGWSARDNYAQQGKKKKRKRDKSQEITNPKKCRARYGLDRQNEWCKPCRRKKKCIRFVVGGSTPTDGITAASGISEAENENIDAQGNSDSPPPPPTTSTTPSNTMTSSDT